MALDYTRSRFENADAEESWCTVMDNGADDSIYEGDSVIFDLVVLDTGRRVILLYDSVGFIWIEYAGVMRGDPGVERHWAALRAEWSLSD